MFDPVIYDDAVIVSLPFVRNFIDLRRISPTIVAHKDPQARTTKSLCEQLRNYLRAIRRLRPVQKDNFALNKLTFLDDALAQLFGVHCHCRLASSEVSLFS